MAPSRIAPSHIRIPTNLQRAWEEIHLRTAARISQRRGVPADEVKTGEVFHEVVGIVLAHYELGHEDPRAQFEASRQHAQLLREHLELARRVAELEAALNPK